MSSSSSSSSIPNVPKESLKQLESILETITSPLSDEETAQIVKEFGDGTSERTEQLIAFCKRSASSLELTEKVVSFLLDAKAFSPEDRDNILFVLSWLSSPLTSFLFTGHYSAFSDLTLEKRVAVIRDWGTSMFETKRLLHKLFKLLCFHYYLALPLEVEGESGKQKINPSWSVLGYQGPDPDRDSEKFHSQISKMYEFTMFDCEKETERDFDAIVIGSGCGGGVMAAELSAAGYRVLVVEKGKYVHQKDFSLVELESMETFFEQQGTLSTTDGGMAVLAGSCFGGGSTINWCCSLQTPYHVRKEWTDLGLSKFLSEEFQNSLEAISQRVNVTDEGIIHNGQNQILLRGCKKLGFACKTAPQNIRPADKSHHQCGWCSLGCRYGEKQGTQVTYLRDAALHGAKFVDNCYVTKVTTTQSSSGRSVASGIQAVWTKPDGSKLEVTFRAGLVAVAGGAIHTPLILKRSGLKNPWIGNNLRLHPVIAALGVFKEKVQPWVGSIMTTVCTEGELGPDKDYYGAKLETPSLHPGLGGCVLPWVDPFQSKRSQLAFPHTSTIIVLNRDSGSGSVSEEGGYPKINYTVSKKDSASMISGLKQACQILIAAGAVRISVGANGVPEYVCHPELGILDPAFNEWWKTVEAVGTKTNQCAIFSAHQMGTARMGATPSKGAITPFGETWEVGNLYVCDTSTFPTPSGTNPMVTCFAISHFIAKNILKKQQKIPSKL